MRNSIALVLFGFVVGCSQTVPETLDETSAARAEATDATGQNEKAFNWDQIYGEATGNTYVATDAIVKNASDFATDAASPTSGHPSGEGDSDMSDLAGIPSKTLTSSNPSQKNSGFAAYQGGQRRPALQVASRSGSARPEKMGQESFPTKVELRAASHHELDRIIEGYRGKIVFVDFWATWCGPCVGAFPYTVDLHKRGFEHDLRVITVSIDKPEKEQGVLRFLEEHQATCLNLLAKQSAFQSTSIDFGIPGGAIPHFHMYDRKGKKRYDWTGGGKQTALDIRRRALELMRE